MTYKLDDFICGGYLLTQFFDGTECNQWIRDDMVRKGQALDEDLLPAKILSVGLCGIETAPLFEWMGASEEDCARFGIAGDRLADVTAWANERFEKEVGYPDLFLSLDAAKEYIRHFVTLPNENQLLGIGLHPKNWPDIEELQAFHPSSIASNGVKISGFVDRGFYQALARQQPLTTGRILGFDVIGYYYDIDHSWHCNNLAVEGFQRFGFRPNQWGLIDDLAHADQLAAYANEEMIEDSTWMSVLVVQIPIESLEV